MNVRWHTQIYDFLRQGPGCSAVTAWDEPDHRTAAVLLAHYVEQQGAASLVTGGNLFLDAMTWHKNDTARLNDTLGVSFRAGPYR